MRLEQWMRELASALARNVRDESLIDIARSSPTLALALGRGEALVRRALPYRFVDDQRILSLHAAVDRGWGACGDATAALAAVAVVAGAHTVALCYEDTVTERGYAHVRILADDVVGDAYRDQRLDVQACSHVITIDRLMGSRWRAAAARRATGRGTQH